VLQSDKIFLLHGKGGSPDGSVKQLEVELRRYYPADISSDFFQRPKLSHSNPKVLAEQSLADLAARNIPQNAVVIGISFGGLLAARLQEQGREDLCVVAISAPTWADAVRVEKRMPNRIALYSSNDEVLAGRTKNWPQLAQAFDLPWLTHDTDRHKRELARLAFAYLNGESVPMAIQDIETAIG
jgi:pimeloyl-ACP methyl ester carboxylesterase